MRYNVIDKSTRTTVVTSNDLADAQFWADYGRYGIYDSLTATWIR